MADFDQAARFATEAEPETVLHRVLRPTGAALSFREWVDTRTTPRPGERDQTADRVAALMDAAAPEQPWLLVFEFQAQPDPDKLDATLVEAAQFRRALRHGPDRSGKYKVLVALVYLWGRCSEEQLDMTLPSGHGTCHRPLIWNVADDSAAAALAEVESGQIPWGLLFWISLMAGAAEPAIIQRWKALLPTVPDQQRGNLVQTALILAELAGCYYLGKNVAHQPDAPARDRPSLEGPSLAGGISLAGASGWCAFLRCRGNTWPGKRDWRIGT